MKKRIGVTGGIGSGKSTVCNVIEKLGFPVYQADIEAKRLMQEQKQVIDAICSLLGNEAYHKDGHLNRSFIATKVFNDKKLLKALNTIVHPAVLNDFNHWVDRQTSPIVFMESALLHECQWEHHFDKVVEITAPINVRIERVMKRDHVTHEQVVERLKHQLTEEERVKLSSVQIKSGKNDLLIPQILKLIKELEDDKNQ